MPKKTPPSPHPGEISLFEPALRGGHFDLFFDTPQFIVDGYLTYPRIIDPTDRVVILFLTHMYH